MLPAPKLHVATSLCKLLIWGTPGGWDSGASAREPHPFWGPKWPQTSHCSSRACPRQEQALYHKAGGGTHSVTDEDHPSQAFIVPRIMQQDSDEHGGAAGSFAIRGSKISSGKHLRVSGWQPVCFHHSPVNSAPLPRKQWGLYFKVPRQIKCSQPKHRASHRGRNGVVAAGNLAAV